MLIRFSDRKVLLENLLYAASRASQIPGGFMTYDDTRAWQDVSELLPQMTINYIFLLKKGPT
jgi:hypothetical protein